MPSSDEFDETIQASDTAAPTGETQPRRENVGGTERIGRYVLRKVVARDEGAVVYDAHDPELNRDVVMRVLEARSEDRREGLLGAARAMAKLDHPSLVPIFDSGVTDDGVFLVMPRIGGVTMTRWLKEGARSWRDVLERFVRAARALVAAHSVGVAHRNVTSDSVLLDGAEVFVTGFAFTPGGGAVENAAADQKALREAVRAAVGKDAPAWLSAATERSWPSLVAFTDHVDGRLRRRRRVAVGTGAVAAIAIGVGALFVAFPRQSATGCPDPRPRLAGVWDAKVRGELASAFKSAAPAIGESVVARVVPALDGYAETWRASQIETCKAARVKRTQPTELFDRRQACLERRLEAFHGLVATLAQKPEAIVVTRADDAVAGLPDIGDCERADQLMAQPPRPTDAGQRARIEAHEKELDEVHAMRLRGHMKDGLDRAGKAVETARQIGYAPVLARALLLRAQFEIDARLPSEGTLRELAQVAADARIDQMTALAWIRLMNDLGTGVGKPADGRALMPVAEAAVVRAGSPPDLLYEFHLAAGGVEMVGDNLEAAETHFTAALELATDDKRRASALQFRAKGTMLKKGPVAAIPLAEEALAATEKALGPAHPEVAEVVDLLAQANVVSGNFDAADAYARREIAIYEAIYGPLHPRMSSALRVLTHIATMREKHTEARDLARRALRIAEQAGDSTLLANAHVSLAQSLAMTDGLDAARPHYEEGLGQMAKARGKDHQAYVRIENDFASKLAANGHCDEATPYLEHSIAFFEPKRPELTAMPRQLRAQCAEKAGKKDAALADLERADGDCRKASCEPAIQFSAMAALGKMLVETGKDKARGGALLNEARAGFEAKGMVGYVDETDRMMKALGVKRR